MDEKEKTKIIEKIIEPILVSEGFEYEYSFEEIDGNTWEYFRKCRWGGMQIVEIYDKFTYIDMRFFINASGYVPVCIGRLLLSNSIQIKKNELMGYSYNNETEFYNHVVFFKQAILDYGLSYLDKINREYELKQG